MENQSESDISGNTVNFFIASKTLNKNCFDYTTYQIDTTDIKSEFICDLIRKHIEHENKIKTDVSNMNGRVITHIYEKIDRGHNQIYDYKFKDYLLSVGYDKEITDQIINYLCDSYDGSLDLDDTKSFFNLFTSSSWSFKPVMHLDRLLNCSLMPGFLDSFSDDCKLLKYDMLWSKLNKFLLSHRLPSESINEAYLENRLVVLNLRKKLLFEIEKNFSDENQKNKTVCIDHQCFSHVKVCCSREKLQGLIDGNSHTYWQTNNEKCENHWISISIKENIKLTSLSLNTISNKNDDTLKSLVIEVRAGSTLMKVETVIAKCDFNLTNNNDYLICSCFPSDQEINYLKIVFKRQNEKNFWNKISDQIKVKSIKLVGKKIISKSNKISVQDASVCWYFEMLSSLSLIQSQIIPSLHTKILQITKSALQNIPPLSLTVESRNGILTSTVLKKVDEFLKNFREIMSVNMDDKSNAILLYLSFNLARGNIKAILDSLLLILENFDLNYTFIDIIQQIDQASQISLRKSAQPINLKFLKLQSNADKNIDNNDVKYLSMAQQLSSDTSADNNQIEIISDSGEETCDISLKPYLNSKRKDENIQRKNIICYNMLLLVEQNVTITNINIKLKLESIGIRSAVVIIIFNRDTPDLDKYEQFDNLDQEKFNLYKEKNKQDKSECQKDYEICFFDFFENQIDIFLELPIFHLAKYVLIKFIRFNESSTKNLVINKFRVLGCRHDGFELYDELKQLQKHSKDSTSNSAIILVNAVLWFLCQLAQQHRNKDKNEENEERFIDFEEFEINDLWKVYEKSIDIGAKKSKSPALFSYYTSLKIPCLILFYELVNCEEIKINNQNNRNAQTWRILDNLCEIIDRNDENTTAMHALDRILKKITKEIIKNGISVFFPSDKECREYFLQIIEKNTSQTTIEKEKKEDAADITNSNEHSIITYDTSLNKPSGKLLFEAFCNLFCSNKANMIQHLINSKNIFDTQNDYKKIIQLIDKMIRLSFTLGRSNNLSISLDDINEDKLVSSLVDLINSIQSSLFFNLRNWLIKSANESTSVHVDQNNFEYQNLINFLNEYTNLLIEKSASLYENFKSNGNHNLKCFFTKLVYNFILWLYEIFSLLKTCVCTEFIKTLIDFQKNLSGLNEFFKEEKTNSEEKILKTWTFNSKTKSSIFDLVINYDYPLASRFVVEFDPNSVLVFTESSELTTYSFIDSDEKVYLFSGKLGSMTWKEKIDIKSNSYIVLNIRSNKDLKSSNTFFLKFNVHAYGYEKCINKVLFTDLNESLASLVGMHLSRIYSERFSLFDVVTTSGVTTSLLSTGADFSNENTLESTSTTKQNVSFSPLGYQHQLSVNLAVQRATTPDESTKTFADLNSKYFRILFRGGHSNKVSDEDIKLFKFLTRLAQFDPDSNLKTNTDLMSFIKLYDKQFDKSKLGGSIVTRLVFKILAAMIWHNSSIEYEHLFKEDNTPLHCNQVQVAFKLIESSRMFIVEQQQLNKLIMLSENQSDKHHQSFIDSMIEKADYLLKFQRLPKSILSFELMKLTRDASTISTMHRNELIDSLHTATYKSAMEQSKIQQSKKLKSRLPKMDDYPVYNILFEFLVEPDCDLKKIDDILALKRDNAQLLTKNFQYSVLHLQNIQKTNTSEYQSQLELILIFLSSFFATESITVYTNDKCGKKSVPPSSNDKCKDTRRIANLQFPPSLKFRSKHYLDKLYSCGLDVESDLRQSYYEFVNFLLNYSNAMRTRTDVNPNLIVALDCYVTILYCIEWELGDLKYVYESNLIEYLIHNACKSIPLSKYEDSYFKTSSDLLEDLFKLSKEKFDEAIKTTATNCGMCENANKDPAELKKLASLEEVEDEDLDDKHPSQSIKSESTSTNSTELNEDSFDLKLFPNMYQKLFQANDRSSNGKQFDTDGLIKCLTFEIKTYEHYEKFIVTRYMFWKYFSKLKTNFYCDSCAVILTGNRYVCLECRDHCFCISCFVKSMVNVDESTTPGDKSQMKRTKINFVTKGPHNSAHRMLLLDHVCNQCNSLIIGKRIRCEQCDDYDLCLMCYRDSLKSGQTAVHEHHSAHRITIHEPVIMVAKPEHVTHSQVFLYLQSKILFTIFSLRLADCLMTGDNLIKGNYYLKRLFSNNLSYLLGMISHAASLNSTLSLNNSFLNGIELFNIKLFAYYNQETLVGLLSSLLGQIKLNDSTMLDHLDESVFNKPNLLSFLFVLLDPNTNTQFDDNVYIMLINQLANLILACEPSQVDQIASTMFDSSSEVIYSTFEMVLTWIEKFILADQRSIVTGYFNLMFKLSHGGTRWSEHLNKFLYRLLDSVAESSCFSAMSRYFTFIYLLNFMDSSIVNGTWLEYKGESLYDSAGILRSNVDFRVGLTKIFYNDSFSSYPRTYFISLIDPESRQTFELKNKKYDVHFRKSNAKTKQIKSHFHFTFTLDHLKLAFKIIKKLISLTDPVSNQSDQTTNTLKQLETNHINKKRKFLNSFQKLNLTNNLLVNCLLNIIRNYYLNDDESNVVRESIDHDFFTIVYKLAFLNTNLNPYWKLDHLKNFLTALVFHDDYSYLKACVETEEYQTLEENKKDVVEVSLVLANSGESSLSIAQNQTKAKPLIQRFKTLKIFNSDKETATAELSMDELKLNPTKYPILNISELSNSFILSSEDQNLIERIAAAKRNKQSLKLLDDCMEKLSKFDLNAVNISKLSPLAAKSFNKKTIPNRPMLNELVLNTLKTTSSAIIILTSRKLLIELIESSINLSMFKFNYNNEFEFLQLLDILFYTDNSKKYRSLLHCLVVSLNGSEVKDIRLLTRLSHMACDLMLPEFKLVKKVNWSSEDKHEYDSGRIRSRLNSEKLTEENVNFTQQPISFVKQSVINDSDYGTAVAAGSSISSSAATALLLSKPSDIEKLSTSDSNTNLLVMFDGSQFKSTTVSGPSHQYKTMLNYQIKGASKIRRLRFNKFIKQTKSTAQFQNTTLSSIWYQLTDDFETNKTKSKLSTQKGESGDQIEDDFSDDSSFENQPENLSRMKLLDKRKRNDVKLLNTDDKQATTGAINTTKNDMETTQEVENDEYDNYLNEQDNDTDNDRSLTNKKPSAFKSSSRPTSSKHKKTPVLNFQLVTKKKDSNNEFNESDFADLDYTENNAENDHADDEDDEDEDNDEDNDYDDEDDSSLTSSSSSSSSSISSTYTTESTENNNSDNEYALDPFCETKSDCDLYDSTDDWYTNTNSGGESDDEKFRKTNFKFPLDQVENIPYLSFLSNKLLKWKFGRREESDWTVDNCSFKVYSIISKNFDSSYNLLEELVEQMNLNLVAKTEPTEFNTLWTDLIKICCVQSFNRRLKVIGLLIKIIRKILNTDDYGSNIKQLINLFDLKPLKNLQYTLESMYKQDRNLSRALFELFFFAEKLAIKWCIEREFIARLRDREEYLEKICETSYYISLIMASFNNTNVDEPESSSRTSKLTPPKLSKPVNISSLITSKTEQSLLKSKKIKNVDKSYLNDTAAYVDTKTGDTDNNEDDENDYMRDEDDTFDDENDDDDGDDDDVEFGGIETGESESDKDSIDEDNDEDGKHLENNNNNENDDSSYSDNNRWS